MTPQELAAAVEKMADSGIDAAGKPLKAMTKELMARLQKALAELDVDVFGNIAQTPANYSRMLSFVNKIVVEIFGGNDYVAAVKTFVETMMNISNAGNVYFSANVKNFNAADPVLAAARAAAVENAAVQIFSAPAPALAKDLSEILADSISGGASYQQIFEKLSERLTGNEGMLARHVRTAAKDSVMQFNRTYDSIVAKQYRMVFYLYEGGLQTTSRPFCKEKEGHYFHEREIRSWASENWEGKNPATTADNIFTLAGGFNCNHKLIPVDISIVPSGAVQRAVAGGYLSKEELNILLTK